MIGLATRCFIAQRSLLIPCDNQLAADFVEFFYQAEHRGRWFLNCCDYRVEHLFYRNLNPKFLCEFSNIHPSYPLMILSKMGIHA